MNLSLIDHNRGYQLTSWDLSLSLLTGLSGATLAKRHLEMSYLEGTSRWGHRMIGLVGYMPVLGGLVALVEYIAYVFFSSGYSTPPWEDKTTSSETQKIMTDNTIKLITKRHFENAAFATPNQACDTLTKIGNKQSTPLACTHESYASIGYRKQMEDAHFYLDLGPYILAGVFDGHGGKEVSRFASEEFQKRFQDELTLANGNVKIAFDRLFHHVHQDIVKHPVWNQMGCTATVCCIEKETHEIITATLGDSEANIYRNVGWGYIKSIPLSPTSDWITDKDRMIQAYGKDTYEKIVERAANKAKYIYSSIRQGVNVARALGDVEETGTPSTPLVIHEPNITIAKLKPGDVVIIACDGLKDYLPEDQINHVIEKRASKIHALKGKVWGEKNTLSLPEELGKEALKNMKETQGDNITVLSIQVA